MAVVTNCTSNHLDWHGTFDRYAAAKRRLLLNQSSHGTAVLNCGDPVVSGWRRLVRGRLISIHDDDHLPPLAVHGQHQRCNAACAAGAARAAGCSAEAIHRGLQNFRGLPHRLQFVAEVDGRPFYNDSMATTPESVMAAVAAFREGAWFLVGGYDKGLDYGAMAAELAREREASLATAQCARKSLPSSHERLRGVAKWLRSSRSMKPSPGVVRKRVLGKRSCFRPRARATISSATIAIAARRSSRCSRAGRTMRTCALSAAAARERKWRARAQDYCIVRALALK